MIFFANRSNLDIRSVHTRIHNKLQTRAITEETPIKQVWYHPSKANKIGVRATIIPDEFLTASYPVAEAELQISFEFPQTSTYDYYSIQWVESDREFMLGWHQDEMHMDLGECHFQVDFQGETVQRNAAVFLDSHPLNVFDQRLTDLVAMLDVLTWENNQPQVPNKDIR